MGGGAGGEGGFARSRPSNLTGHDSLEPGQDGSTAVCRDFGERRREELRGRRGRRRGTWLGGRDEVGGGSESD